MTVVSVPYDFGLSRGTGFLNSLLRQGLGFKVWGSGFRVQGLGSGFRVQGFRV